MLNHDMTDHPPVMAGTTAPPTVTPPLTPNASATDYDVYNNLAPYGYWNEVPDYGWCWQPYSGLGYDYYPWGWLGLGYWWNFPGRGWCWFPHSHFRGFDRFRATRSSFAFRSG